MLLRKADLQSLLYMAVYPALIAWQWFHGIQWYFYATILLLSVGLAVTQHNHTHLRMWRWKPLNRITDLYLSIIQSTPSYVFSHHILVIIIVIIMALKTKQEHIDLEEIITIL